MLLLKSNRTMIDFLILVGFVTLVIVVTTLPVKEDK